MPVVCKECIFQVALIWLVNCDQIVIRTNNGAVSGRQKHIAGKNVYEFLGIPYAKPPIGDLRFKNPEKLHSWKNILNVTSHPRPCIQPMPDETDRWDPTSRVWLPRSEPSEDCLYLNLWTRAGNHSLGDDNAAGPVMLESSALFGPKTGRPVMVWIHGGSLTHGSIGLEIYNGAYLASMMNVVVVTVQYRLGVFGFLYLGTEDAPGNQGLMDQVTALEWLRENVAYFGGNPQQITLFGHSGGVVSVALHLLSPVSSTLFQQAILQSGSPLAWWAVESPRTALEKAYVLAELVGCRVHGPKETHVSELSKCLRSLDVTGLIYSQQVVLSVLNQQNSARTAHLKKLYGGRFGKDSSTAQMQNLIAEAAYYYDIPFKPVVATSLLPQWPYEILGTGKLNIRHRIMLGVNKDEGMFHLIHELRMLTKLPHNWPRLLRHIDQLPPQIDPIDLLALFIMNENFLHPALLQATAFEYQIPSRSLGRIHWTADQVFQALNEVGGDYNIKCPVVEFADFYSRGSNAQVFVYSFEHRTDAITWPSWTGIMQGYEAEYIFGAPFNPDYQKEFYNFTDDERRLSAEMMRFWTNFASTGSPNLNPGEFHTRNKELYWERYTSVAPISQTTYGSETKRRASAVLVEDNSRKHMVFKLPHPQMERNLRRHQCMFWREQLPMMREHIVFSVYEPCVKSLSINASNPATLPYDLVSGGPVEFCVFEIRNGNIKKEPFVTFEGKSHPEWTSGMLVLFDNNRPVGFPSLVLYENEIGHLKFDKRDVCAVYISNVLLPEPKYSVKISEKSVQAGSEPIQKMVSYCGGAIEEENGRMSMPDVPLTTRICVWSKETEPGKIYKFSFIGLKQQAADSWVRVLGVDACVPQVLLTVRPTSPQKQLWVKSRGPQLSIIAYFGANGFRNPQAMIQLQKGFDETKRICRMAFQLPKQKKLTLPYTINSTYSDTFCTLLLSTGYSKNRHYLHVYPTTNDESKVGGFLLFKHGKFTLKPELAIFEGMSGSIRLEDDKYCLIQVTSSPSRFYKFSVDVTINKMRTNEYDVKKYLCGQEFNQTRSEIHLSLVPDDARFCIWQTTVVAHASYLLKLPGVSVNGHTDGWIRVLDGNTCDADVLLHRKLDGKTSSMRVYPSNKILTFLLFVGKEPLGSSKHFVRMIRVPDT